MSDFYYTHKNFLQWQPYFDEALRTKQSVPVEINGWKTNTLYVSGFAARRWGITEGRANYNPFYANVHVGVPENTSEATEGSEARVYYKELPTLKRSLRTWRTQVSEWLKSGLEAEKEFHLSSPMTADDAAFLKQLEETSEVSFDYHGGTLVLKGVKKV